MGYTNLRQMNKDLLFLHIPKTGGTFLYSYLKEAYGSNIVLFGHGNIREFPEKRKYFKFAILRNPFDWYVSRYFYYFRKQMVEKGVSIDCDSGFFGEYFRNNFPTFKGHFYWGFKNKQIDFSFSYRIRNISYTRGHNSINYYGKLESLYDLNRVISEKCGLDPTITIPDYEAKSKVHPDERKINHKHYSEYYDDDMIKLVLEKDADILSKFGYTFERK